MKVLICGGAGFIGRNLSAFLKSKGVEVAILDRNRVSSQDFRSFQGDLLSPSLYEERWFEGIDAVINLSGRDIFTLWTKNAKKEIFDSRVTVNKNLIDFMSTLQRKPSAFISASAVGYYGDRGDTELTEESGPGANFLSEVCLAWEAEAKRAEGCGMRSVQVRTAPVLLQTGGILKELLKSMRFGFTVNFGGDQWLSWIHMKDLLRTYHLAVTDPSFYGPVNASAPAPERFGNFLRKVTRYRRAVVLPFPAPVLRTLAGETADLILSSERVIPARLLERGFTFEYPALDEALRDIFR
jgi:uncharacterized protein